MASPIEDLGNPQVVFFGPARAPPVSPADAPTRRTAGYSLLNERRVVSVNERAVRNLREMPGPLGAPRAPSGEGGGWEVSGNA